MSVRFNAALSDHLCREIEMAAAETETNKSDVLRKALQLYWLHVKARSADGRFDWLNQ